MQRYFKAIKDLPVAVKSFLITELFYGFAVGIWGMALNFHLIDRGFSNTGVGAMIAFGSIITASSSLIIGLLCGRMGFKRGMVIGCVIRAIGIIFIGMSSNVILIIIGQALSGVGGAFIYTSELPLLLHLIKGRQMNVAYNLQLCIYQLAMFLGNIAAGFMPGIAIKYFSNYGFSILFCGVMFIAMGFGRCYLPNINAEQNLSNSFNIIKNQKMSSFLMYGIFEGAIISILLSSSMMNTIFRSAFNLNDKYIGLLYSISTLVAAVASFIVPMILMSWRSTKVANVVLLINIGIFIILGYCGLITFVVLWLLFSLLNAVLLGVTESQMLMAINEADRGIYSGVVTCFKFIGTGIGALISGWILQYSNYSRLMFIGAVIVAVQYFVYIHTCKKHIREEFDFGDMNIINNHSNIRSEAS